ncbi:MAG TPA: NAD(P)H-binding protein [Mycobacterium sp.]|nr:NAD(P)H-binding protein [Mycobacterium sp.]
MNEREIGTKLVVFGVNGQTGRLLTSHALPAGHPVVAVTRHPRDLPVVGPGLTVAGVDVRDEAAVGDVVGADAVLSTLGVSFTREHVDTYSVGAANIVAGSGPPRCGGWSWSVRPPSTPPAAPAAR